MLDSDGTTVVPPSFVDETEMVVVISGGGEEGEAGVAGP